MHTTEQTQEKIFIYALFFLISHPYPSFLSYYYLYSSISLLFSFWSEQRDVMREAGRVWGLPLSESELENWFYLFIHLGNKDVKPLVNSLLHEIAKSSKSSCYQVKSITKNPHQFPTLPYIRLKHEKNEETG